MIDFFTNLVWPAIWPILSSQYFLGALTMQLLYTTQSFSTWLIQSLFEFIKNAFLKQFVFAVEIFDGTPLRDAYSQHVTKRNQSAPSSVVFAKSVCEKIVFFNDADSHWVWLDDSLLTYVSHKDQVLTIRCAYGQRERLKCILSSLVEFRHCIEPSDKVTIWRFQEYQNISNVVSARLLSGIFLPKGVVENLVARLQLFFEQKHFYIRNNIPYRLGLLLHGVPGTGKTSLINALAAYFNLPIMVTDKVENLKKLQNAPARIVVLEDVDRIFKKSNPNPASFEQAVAENNLCELLNFIDGLASPQNQILIMTTNHIEELDPALIRPGRIDVQIEFGYADRSQVARAIDRFYFSDFEIADSHQLSHSIGNAQSRLYAHKLCKLMETKGNGQFSMSALMQHFLAYPRSISDAIDHLDSFPLQRKAANVLKISTAISAPQENTNEHATESEKRD